MPNVMHNGDIHTEANVTLTSGKIDFALSYLWCEERLVIKVIQVYDVKLSGGQSLVSPYVKIRIYRTPKHFFTIGNTDETSHVMHNMEKEMKTKMRRPSDILVYKETFDVQMNADSLKNLTLCLLLCDMDKLSRHVTLGETSVVLKKAKLFEVQECLYSEEFHEPIKVKMSISTTFSGCLLYCIEFYNSFVFRFPFSLFVHYAPPPLRKSGALHQTLSDE